MATISVMINVQLCALFPVNTRLDFNCVYMHFSWYLPCYFKIQIHNWYERQTCTTLLSIAVHSTVVCRNKQVGRIELLARNIYVSHVVIILMNVETKHRFTDLSFEEKYSPARKAPYHCLSKVRHSNNLYWEQGARK